ncbi:SDR family NAD(P)-dependent oxidoreductase [candidate division WWE3 bacterium]|uniref:SDR family NAD(P)-dependent oxidoreductase n=1 Tax=candidate division WWE3 bacterium TaxID=2053526 RepID=A0A955IW84_UNCKA|nr:SDR family NAD(P)-dependent oxidoreductase [candidate division WWE3 bacterium]
MKNILITGGSRGIGKATVKRFLGSGYEVITTSTSGKSEYRNTYQLDLSDSNSISDFAKSLSEKNTKIDVLINNAAMAEEGEDFVVIESLRKTLEVNLIGVIDLTQKILPLINDSGVIINISSQMASLTCDLGFDYPSYRISKNAINMYTICLSEHPNIKKRGVKVYSFDPGWVKTDMGGPDAEREPEEVAEELLQLVESGSKTGLFYKGTEAREW